MKNIVDILMDKKYKNKRWFFLSTTTNIKESFVYCFAPLLEYALLEIKRSIIKNKLQYFINTETIKKITHENLVEPIHKRVVRVCVYEMHMASKSKKLIEKSSDMRFKEFIIRLSQPEEVIALLNKYKKLSILLMNLLTEFHHSIQVLLEQFSRDKCLIEQTFNIDLDQHTLKTIQGCGDSHCQGARVYLLVLNQVKLQQETRLIYKPRPSLITSAFNQFTGWLNEQVHYPLRLMTILNRPNCCWCEYITAYPCISETEIYQYYHKMGMLIAIVYLLGGYDIHMENIIAAGDNPVIIDYECLLRPVWPEQAGIGGYPLVTHSLLLPYKIKLKEGYLGIDLSGIAGTGGQLTFYSQLDWINPFTDRMKSIRVNKPIDVSTNIPHLRKKEVTPLHYVKQVLEGFEEIYHLFLSHRHTLLSKNSILSAFQTCQVRIIFRNTWDYGKMIYESWHAKLLYIEADYDTHFSYLYQSKFVPKPLISHEIGQLKGENIPYFYTKANTLDIFTCHEQNVDLKLIQCAYERMQSFLQTNLSSSDLYLQKRLIELAYEAYRINEKIREPLFPHKYCLSSKQSSLKKQLENMVKNATEELYQLAIKTNQKLVWPTLLVQHGVWNPALTNYDLYGGLAGISLAMAYAGSFFNQQPFLDLAKQGEERVAYLLSNQDFLENVSLGAFNGIGGYLYSLVAFNLFTHNPNLPTLIQSFIELAYQKIPTDNDLSIIDGTAGLLLVVIAIQSLLAKDDFIRFIEACALSIIKKYPRPASYNATFDQGFIHPLLGFAHGTSGITLALAHANEYLQNSLIDHWIEAAHHYELLHYNNIHSNWPRFQKKGEQPTKTYEYGWCHGITGLGFSRLLLPSSILTSALEKEIELAIHTLLYKESWGNDCLCHGALGALDFMLMAYQKGALTWKDYQSFEKKIVASLIEQGFRTNWQLNGSKIPGLLLGGAGFIYQILRILEPQSIPSILSLS